LSRAKEKIEMLASINKRQAYMTRHDMFKSSDQFGSEFYKQKPIEPIFPEDNDSEPAERNDSDSQDLLRFVSNSQEPIN